MVRTERSGSALVVTIDRPERRNAVDGPTADALQSAFEGFVADEQARVLVLTGAGGQAFCAGADLKALETLAERLDSPAGPLGFTRLSSPKPTIAAIEGWCLAGGFELALWCDLRIAAEGSQLGFAERRWGVPLIDGGTQRIADVVGVGRALDLVLTGRLVGTAEALAMGLLTQVVEPGHALERALALAGELAAFPQETMLSDRRALLVGSRLPRDQALALEARLGRESVGVGFDGAQRFAAGEGRAGAGLRGTAPG